jgi:hypothetical protein
MNKNKQTNDNLNNEKQTKFKKTRKLWFKSLILFLICLLSYLFFVFLDNYNYKNKAVNNSLINFPQDIYKQVAENKYPEHIDEIVKKRIVEQFDLAKEQIQLIKIDDLFFENNMGFSKKIIDQAYKELKIYFNLYQNKMDQRRNIAELAKSKLVILNELIDKKKQQCYLRLEQLGYSDDNINPYDETLDLFSSKLCLAVKNNDLTVCNNWKFVKNDDLIKSYTARCEKMYKKIKLAEKVYIFKKECKDISFKNWRYPLEGKAYCEAMQGNKKICLDPGFKLDYEKASCQAYASNGKIDCNVFQSDSGWQTCDNIKELLNVLIKTNRNNQMCKQIKSSDYKVFCRALIDSSDLKCLKPIDVFENYKKKYCALDFLN